MNSSASVFEHDGRQYVAAYSAGHVSGGAHGDSVWLFSLGGTLGEALPHTPQLSQESPSRSDAALDVEDGMATYSNSCVFCHGAEGTGGHGGPGFSAARSIEEIQRIVSAGGNTMPPFGDILDGAEIADVSAWVLELAQRAADR